LKKNGYQTIPEDLGKFFWNKVKDLIKEASTGRKEDGPKLPNSKQMEIIIDYHKLVFKLQGIDLQTDEELESEIILSTKTLNKVRSMLENVNSKKL